jgi:hypothetical protein
MAKGHLLDENGTYWDNSQEDKDRGYAWKLFCFNANWCVNGSRTQLAIHCSLFLRFAGRSTGRFWLRYQVVDAAHWAKRPLLGKAELQKIVGIIQPVTAMDRDMVDTLAEASSQHQADTWLPALTNVYEASKEALQASLSKLGSRIHIVGQEIASPSKGQIYIRVWILIKEIVC